MYDAQSTNKIESFRSSAARSRKKEAILATWTLFVRRSSPGEPKEYNVVYTRFLILFGEATYVEFVRTSFDMSKSISELRAKDMAELNALVCAWSSLLLHILARNSRSLVLPYRPTSIMAYSRYDCFSMLVSVGE